MTARTEMTKEKRATIVACLSLLGLLAIMVFAVLIEFYPGIGSNPSAENTPEKLTANIARMVMSKEKPQVFNPDSPDFGSAYIATLYSRYAMYEVTVYSYENGKRGLSVGFYKTNVDFDSIKNPADAIARELIYGKPTTAIEEHMFTDRADGRLEMYQIYTKKRGPAFMGFTRKERDLGKKAGVKEVIFDQDKFFENGKWVKATPEEIAEVQSNYLAHLKDIHGLLKK